MKQEEQRELIRKGHGFIAALDQSGGSTPKALAAYGVPADAYSSDEEMFDLVHEMRSRIINAPAFNGDRVIGAILFEMTMDREVGGKPTAAALWEDNGVVPFLKIDKGLADPEGGVQVMKPMPQLDDLCKRAADKGIFGTKMRSVISVADKDAIDRVVAQQFEVGKQILAHGLMPIIEPEVTITIADKAEAEELLLASLTEHLDALPDGVEVMLKLTLPEVDNLYASLVDHPAVLRIVALSGGYSREEANARLSRNRAIIASFSRALTEGLRADQSDEEFNETIAATIKEICAASLAC